MSPSDAGPAWSAWMRVTPVVAAPVSRGRYVRLRLPRRIEPAADGGYPDLRIIDARGGEVPYALDPSRRASPERALSVIDIGFVPHRWTQAVLDLGASGDVVDAVTLDVSANASPTFFAQTALDASDDRRTWRIVRDDAIVYRVAQDGGHGSTTLTFPPTRSRWLRVRILDPRAPFPIAGAHSATQAPREPALAPLSVAAHRVAGQSGNVQTWMFTDGPRSRAAAVVFAPGRSYYERHVRVDTSDDTKDWTPVGEGTISRYAEGGAQLTLALTETTARIVRVSVENGNDAPVPGLVPRLLGRSHDIVFEPRGGPYRLLSQNPSANAPQYDLGARLAHENWVAAEASAGAGTPNAGYRDSRPVGERFPWLVSAALFVVAILLGGLALRTIRRGAQEAPS